MMLSVLEGIEDGDQQLEAITVVRELKRLDEYFAFIRNDWGEMVEFGNINASAKHHEVAPPFLKSDTVISTSDYQRRLDWNKYSWVEISRHIQLINDSDKSGGNTLL